MDDSQQWVRIERRFDAPIETIWAMWTDPQMFQKWYGPRGMRVPVAEMTVKVGGARKICMEMVTPERTMQMWFTGVYKEVSAPRRLVYTEAMCDADGNILSPSDMGMPDGSPDITEVIIELSEVDGGTRMVMVHVGVPEGSPGGGGWAQAFDKLAEVLAG